MPALTLLIIDKSGSPKITVIKDYKHEELYKKCGFKKTDGLELRHTWVVKCDRTNYRVSVFAKDDGKSNMVNKFEFPPPIDTVLYFGSCAVIVEHKNSAGDYVPCNITIPLWDKLYEKLFGGFESLTKTCKEDEEETDELETILKHKKTGSGYLKDGFIVDSDAEDGDAYNSDSDASSASNMGGGGDDDDDVKGDNNKGNNVNNNHNNHNQDNNELEELGDIGSELSEDSYTY